MLFKAATLMLAAQAVASPLDLVERQSGCPPVHIFGARETTASPGYGTAGVVVNLVLNSNSGSTAEAISYPACGGQSSCGGQSYSQSAVTGTAAVASAVNSFNSRCPNTKLVLVGYSQGGQIMDNAFCGGGDSTIGLGSTAVPISAAALNMIKAVIEMGSPRYRAGAPYNVGTCSAYGFGARPQGYVCPSASKLKSYCDSTDPYCCTGNDANSHQQYGVKYGQQALTFINGLLNAGGSTNPTPTTTARPQQTTTTAGGNNPPATTPAVTTAGNSGGNCGAKYNQCGGIGWSGATCCASGSTCKYGNDWYSQCL